MKVLVIGGTGFIGKAIAALAQAQGHEVVLFNRGQRDIPVGMRLIQGDLAELTKYREALRAEAPEVVVHCIAFTPQQAEDLVTVFAGRESHLVVLGSADCYLAFQQVVRQQEITVDYPITENSPLSNIEYYWRGIMDEHPAGPNYDKNLMTAILMQAAQAGKIQPTVFRLPMVYGPGDHQFAFRHGEIIRRIYDQQPRYLLGQNKQNTIWHYGYIENIAAGVCHAFGKAQTFGEVYNLGELQVRPWLRWVRLYAEAAGFDFEIQTFAEPEALPQHLILDCQKYVRQTQFSEPISLTQGISATLAYGLAQPEVLGQAPDYADEAQRWEKTS